MKNLIFDPVYTSEYYREYLNTIMYYQDQKRAGIFTRYYNINTNASANTSQTSANLARSNYSYDVYEYTPVLAVDETTDTVQDDPEKSGLMFQGEMGITTYSIQYPRIHDIISFAYAPYTTDHIYRVKGISTVLNIHDVGLHISKLELEYAFNKSNLNSLSIIDEYVYSVYDKKNILKSVYTTIMTEQSKLSSVFAQLLFDEYSELYYYIDANGEKIAPLFDNSNMLSEVTTKNNKRQYFPDLKPPFGSNNYANIVQGDYYNITQKTTGNGPLPISTVTDVATYSSSSADAIISDSAKLLSLFQG